MRIYLAARFGRREELGYYAECLRMDGHEVTSRWLEGHEAEHDAAPTAEEMQRWAEEDIEDLERAEMVICFTEEAKSEHSRGGRHVEFGYALAKGKRVVHVGPTENVFYALDRVEHYTRFSLLRKMMKG